jgi:tetratricopeptide (TPR) repeat protein
MLAWLLGLVRPSSPGSELEASDADSAQALTAPTEATTGSSDEDASAVDAAPEVDEARANDVPDDAPFEDAKRVSTSSAVDATPLLGFEAQEALDDLCADGWCLRTPGQGDEAQDFVIADGEIAELALAQLRPRVLRRRRRQLAQQLAPLGPVGAGRVEFFLIACRLFLEAGDGKEAARVALAGAEVLEQVSCYMEALELIEGVVLVSLVRDPADRRALREIQVRLLDATGNHREAVEATSELFREGREGAVYYRRLRGDSYGKLGEVEKQIREYEAAAEQLGGMSCSTAELGLLANLGKAYLAQGDVERATKCLEQCLDRLPEDSEAVEEEAADIFELAASLKREKREFAGALEIVSGLVRKASTQDDRSLEIEKIRQKAELLVALGQGHAAKDSLRDALDVAGKTGSRWLVAEQLVALGRFWLDSGNPSAALAYTEQAYGIFQDVGREEEAQALRVLLFTLELELGFLSRARVNITAFARRWVESRVPALSVTRPSWMTDADGRRRELRRIEKVAAKRPESLVVEDYRLCVDLLEDEGKLDAALQMCRERLHSEGIGADSDSRLALYLSLGRILTLQGDTRAALRYLEKGSLAASDDGSEELLVRFSAAASEVFLRRGELARSFDAAVRGLRIAHREPRAETLVPVLLCVADFLMETGVLDVACDCAETAFLLARADGFQRWEVAAALRAGQIHRALGRRAESLERLADAETLIERLGLPVDDCRLKLERAWQSFDAGNYTDASRLARQGLEIARPLQLTPLLAEFLFFLGVLSGERRNSRRNFPRALEFLDQALGLADSLESSRMRWETLELGANLHQERGNSELAEEYSSRAEEILWEAFGGLPDSLKGLGFRSRLGERDKPRSPTLAV